MDKKSGYIDVDRIVVEPSPLRIRNILTLEERVRAIQAYDCRPMYTKVAKMFNCSWEQIKNIITNRDAIIRFYEATKNTDKANDPNLDDIRQSKISFLGKCLYEYIQRAQLYKKTDLSEDLLRTKALEFRDLIQIDHFTPNKAWINHFKATYNFSLSNRQIMLTRIPPSSMDLKDIMMYCSKNKSKGEKQKHMRSEQFLNKNKKIASANKCLTTEFVGMRKISFLEKSLLEYIRRIQYHPKTSLNDDLLLKTACHFRDLLKIDNFVPNRRWFDNFKKKYNISFSKNTNSTQVKSHITLDLRDILSYCSRSNKNEQSHNLSMLEAKSSDLSNSGKMLNYTYTSGDLIEQASSDIFSTECNDDVKPIIIDLEDANSSQKEETAPSLKRRRIDIASHSSTNSHECMTEDELPKRIMNYNDALKYLQPIEEFIMLQENYRAISLVTQLEEIFKNPPKNDNASDFSDTSSD
ncbi:uncharacterized protein LOC119674699 [Teleopsis dalmanni]|uniref:uncharacterized protein LOC119674699 n=1 Tax=Teleopsis dalmanni TaxID=139649 RepID=UPI0018CF2AD2|nr:uncharacterized protein LOC119674699 [Teleopsis dalmanni]